LTSLVGRDRDLEEIAATLTTARLVTLTGPGGVGKTRVGLAVAARRCHDLQTYWVELTALSGPGTQEDIVAAICVAAGMPDVSRGDGVARLAAAFDHPPALLLLDNAEHVIRACAEVVDALLRLCPALQILVTSREPLTVEGEHVHRVGPLALPEPGQPIGLDRQDSVELFVQRARAIDGSFELTDGNRADVLAICRAMAGMPLGIELAAARVAAIGIGPVAAVLADPAARNATPGDDPFPGTDRPVRHRSVSASLGWSYDLLPRDQAALFRRLSVFPGSFDIGGAEAVAGDLTPEGTAVRLLTVLVEKSMVVAADRDGETWYRLLAPLQAYAAERLAESTDLDGTVTAHLAYVTELAERLGGAGGSPESPGDLDRLEGALPDIRAALLVARRAHDELSSAVPVPHPVDGTATTAGLDGAVAPVCAATLRVAETRVALGVRLAGLLVRLCYLRGHYQEGQQWLEWAVMAGRCGRPESLAAALRGAGRLAFLRCDYPLATARLREALDLTTELGDQTHVVDTLMWLGSVARETSDYRGAESLCVRARELAAATGDEWSVVRADNYLAFTAWLQGHFDEAVERCQSTMDAAIRIGDTETVIWSTINMGAARLYQGDLLAADDLLQEAARRSERDRFAEGVAWSRHLLGVLQVRRGDRVGALTLLRSALSAHRALDDRWRVTSVVDDLAGLAAVAADGVAAARFLGAADALRRQIGVTPAPVEQDDRRITLRLTRGLLRGKDCDAELEAGAAADVEELAGTLGPVSRPGDAGEVGPDDAGTEQSERGAERPAGSGTERASRSSADRVAEHSDPLPALDIRMLGAATVRVDGRLLRGTDFGYAKPRELLFFLAAGGPASKETIGDALWPDSPASKVKGALHTALRELRRAVGSTSLVGLADGNYFLHPDADITSDLADFEREVAAADAEGNPRRALPRLRRAIGLYGGEFLEGGLRAAWAQQLAVELGDRYQALLLGLGRALSLQGRWASATEVFLHAVHHDPDDVEARRLLVAAWAGVADDGTPDGHRHTPADQVPAEAERWLIELARTNPPFRVTATRSGTRLYQELVRRRRSARATGTSTALPEPVGGAHPQIVADIDDPP
jgi:predicted ATPase/DNA-binding SARP family transcriptional activator